MKRELGRKGENIAADYLKKQGYEIMERNYHTRYGEIDIVCKNNHSLIFVEVKTRRNTTYGTPEEAVTPRKIEHLKKAAYVYLQGQDKYYKELRFDVIGILLQGKDMNINHIKNAF